MYNLLDIPEHVKNDENKNARKLNIIFIDTPEHVKNDENQIARKLYIIFIDTPCARFGNFSIFPKYDT